MRRFKKGDKVVVNGLDMAFVVECYLSNKLVKLFIEGQSEHTMHSLVYARPEVLLPNDEETLIAQKWLIGDGKMMLDVDGEELMVNTECGFHKWSIGVTKALAVRVKYGYHPGYMQIDLHDIDIAELRRLADMFNHVADKLTQEK